MTNSTKFSLSLPVSIYDALSEEAGLAGHSVQAYMRNLLIEAGIDSPHFDHEAGHSILLYRALSQDVADAALAIYHEGGFSADITLHAIQRCQANPIWLENYRLYVGGDEFSTHNPEKASLNQNLGHQVRRVLNADLIMNTNGNPVVKRVTGQIVQTYKQLKNPDPKQ